MHAKPGLLLIVAVLAVPAAAKDKAVTRVVLIGSNGRSVVVGGSERAIAGLLSARGAEAPVGGGYVRLFFVGPGDFPAAPARYYPERRCVALDWPTYEATCRRIGAPRSARILDGAAALPRFRVRPTTLLRLRYDARLRGMITTAEALKPEVELALDRRGRDSPPPTKCYGFSGRWQGPAARTRPRHFALCAAGIYASGRIYPLDRGVWSWFRLNVA